MKNKYKILALSLLLVFGLTSCDDFLDLRPENEIILEDFWETKADVESVLSACYRGLTERACIERMMVWGELRSDNIVEGRGMPNSLIDMRRILIGELTAHNRYAEWESFYAVINYCNTLLHYAPGVRGKDNNFTQIDLQLVQGEAITLRALAYFYLVRAFRDIPYVTEPSISDTQDYQHFQAPEEKVLDNIIKDLEDVISNGWVRDSYGITEYDKGRITKSAVYALLADVYLWKGDLDNCIKACNAALDNPDLLLIEDTEQMFSQIFYRKNSTESIFELQFQQRNIANSAVADLYGSPTSNRGYFAFPTELAYQRFSNRVFTGVASPFNYRLPDNSYESVADIRADYFVSKHAGDLYGLFKYAGGNAMRIGTSNPPQYMYAYNPEPTTSNWIIYRITDVMLMKVEALVQTESGNVLDNRTEAMELLNTTYLRSNPGATPLRITNYPAKQDLEALVLRERQRELLFEGKRWFDLVRMVRRDEAMLATLNKLVQAKASEQTAPLGAIVPDAMYMPILQKEMDVNKNLIQNNYYESTSSSSRN